MGNAQSLTQSGPIVDAAQMLRSGVLQPTNGYPKITSEPKIIFDTANVKLRAEPFCDVTSKSQRFKMTTTQGEILGLKEMSISVGAHGFFVLLFAGVGQFLIPPRVLENEAQPIEVQFGLTATAQFSEQTINKRDDSQADVEALKTAQQLPQLTKTLTVESAEKPPETMPEVPKPTVKGQDSKIPKTPPMIADVPKPEQTVKTLTPEELLKRMEKENRKVGETERKGVKEKAEKGKQTDPNHEIPPNPFGQPLPDAPAGKIPVGAVDGSLSVEAKNGYTIAVKNHLARNWTIPELYNFDSNLNVTLDVTVNTFGNIISEVKIHKSSGLQEFDEEAIRGLVASAPFPELPADLAPRITLRLLLRPRDSKR